MTCIVPFMLAYMCVYHALRCTLILSCCTFA